MNRLSLERDTSTQTLVKKELLKYIGFIKNQIKNFKVKTKLISLIEDNIKSISEQSKMVLHERPSHAEFTFEFKNFKQWKIS